MDDPVTKERFFTTPLCLEAVSGKRPAPAEWSCSDDTPANQAPYGKGSKGSGKKGKGKGKAQKGGGKSKRRGAGNAVARASPGCAAQMPDGTKICFRFNASGCTMANCSFVHVCGKCFAAGVPMHRCKRCGKAPQ